MPFLVKMFHKFLQIRIQRQKLPVEHYLHEKIKNLIFLSKGVSWIFEKKNSKFFLNH